MQNNPVQPHSKTRRRLLRLAVFAGLVGTVYGGTGLLRRLTAPELAFTPVAGLPGFRKIEGGPISGGASFMVGLEGSRTEVSDDTGPRISKAALCQTLFGRSPDPARVQIAYFTDARCLYCRQVSPMMVRLEKAGEVQVTWHDLPLLGQISTVSARASVAAAAQGAYGIFHKRLMGTPALPTPPFLRQLAEEAGINPSRLLRDMESEQTTRQLATSAAIAKRFGFVGTPALVVGRTAVLGGIDQRLIDRMIAAERAEDTPGGCQS